MCGYDFEFIVDFRLKLSRRSKYIMARSHAITHRRRRKSEVPTAGSDAPSSGKLSRQQACSRLKKAKNSAIERSVKKKRKNTSESDADPVPTHQVAPSPDIPDFERWVRTKDGEIAALRVSFT
jgi:hypothetical protein